jgi:acetyl-CoA carboxylase biotin carboxyl carrier protein
VRGGRSGDGEHDQCGHGGLDRHGCRFYSQRPMPTRVNAHITGTVWKIEVKIGDQVAEGQTVVILESMKMEMPVEATAAGKVSAILVKEGDAVEEGAGVVEVT